MKNPRVAIVCDWLTDWGGAERVILAMHEIFPEAPIYTSLYNEVNMEPFEGADIRPSFLQKIPGAKRHHQRFLAQMPAAFESFDLSKYDIVLSSSHSCAKGVITKPDTLHVSYCHSPPRYLWDNSQQYLRDYPWPKWLKRWVIPGLLNKMRVWDRAAADRVDRYIANSAFVAERIKKYYRRESEVIHPPVTMEDLEPEKEREDYYLAVGRLIPYKRFDLIVKAFNELQLPLKIVGVGNQYKKLKKIADRNIEFLGMVPEEELRNYYRYAKGFLFPQVEDFGITPLEAMSYGCPVIAYGKGGALETVADNESGMFFGEQTTEGLKNAVRDFERRQFNPTRVRAQAAKFEEEVFKAKLEEFLMNEWQSFNK
jgi:glycosyltransferase involved in cell wall biosynthesis